MRQLEHALGLLAERAEPLPTEVLLERLEAQLAAEGATTTTARADDAAATGLPQRRPNPGRVLWRGPMIAVGTAVAILAVVGVSLLMLRGGDSFDIADEPTPTTVLEEAVATTTVVPTTTVPTVDAVVPAAWDPILATTKATVAPTAGTCPDGADPDAPGPVDQARPGEGPWSNQAAVFDTHAGRIVFLNNAGETWTFDVCTNTWIQTTPVEMPGVPDDSGRIVGEMVYDADSDRTIAFGPDSVSVYNANMNTWTHRSAPAGLGLGLGSPGLGAVYDPVSGLVLVVTSDGVLMAYDVDTDGWTKVGIITEPREVTHNGQTQTLYPPFLVGYVAEADRLAFLGYENEPFQDDGALVNPRTGNTAPLEFPPAGVLGGFGSFPYATGGDTAYTYRSGVCRLDPVSFDWDCIPNGDTGGPEAVVYDPINHRLVLINNSCCNWPGNKVGDDVWAIDFATGRSIELLDTANTRTETDGS